MARDFDQIAAAAAHIQASQVADETTSLPPGYIQGFYATLNPDYTVTIEAGTAYVAGRAVKMETDHLLAGSDWVAPRLDHPNHYYIYLDKSGSFRVDLVQPVYNRGYGYYEQPDFGWRAIAKIFLKNNDIIYCSWNMENSGSTVTVAPDGYTGEADYYCTGVNDDVLINAAILYVYTAYYGGTVQLLEGTFNIVVPVGGSALTMKSSIVLEGMGSVSNLVATGSSGYAISVEGTVGSRLESCTIRNLKLDTLAATNMMYAIYVDFSDNTKITSCVIMNGYYGIIDNGSTTGTMILNNVVDGDSSVGPGIGGRTGIWGSGTCPIIDNNIIKDFTVGNSQAIGIIISGNSAKCTNNHVYNLTGSLAGTKTYGISVLASYSILSNNRVELIKNSGTATDAIGIWVQNTCTSLSVSSNVCYNNGSDTGIANTNSNNFYDAGTDTQTYSNSWQTPVSGEPAQGELHWLPQSSSTFASLFVNAVTTTAGWVSFTTNSVYPVGAKGMKANVIIQAAASGTGIFGHHVAFSNDYSASPATGTAHPEVGFDAYAGATQIHRLNIPLDIPLDGNRRGYFYSTFRLNATSCLLTIWGCGYTS